MLPGHLHFSLVLCAVLSAKAGAVTFADGRHHVIDADNSFPLEGVVVDDGPGGTQTTLDILDGGEVAIVSEARAGLLVQGRSSVRILGGRVGNVIFGLDLRDDAEATVSGGSVRGVRVGEGFVATGSPRLRIEGGNIQAQVRAGPGSFVHVSGGRILTDLTSLGAALVDISGGQIDRGVSISGETEVRISGGDMSSLRLGSGALASIVGGLVRGTVSIDGGALDDPQTRVEISGGIFDDDLTVRADSDLLISGGVQKGLVAARNQATLTIVGRDFNAPFGELPRPGFFLVGTLADGGTFRGVVSQGPGATAQLVPAPFPIVAIDVRPFSEGNQLLARPHVPILVALLGSEGLDVATVDVTTLAFGPDGAAPVHDWRVVWDVDHDGVDDLLARFFYGETGLPLGAGEACLTGFLDDGTPFEGCDLVNVVAHCGLGAELALLLPPLMWLYRRRRLH